MNETIVESQKKSNIFKGRPIVSIIAAGLLLLLIVVYAIFPLVGLNRVGARLGGQGFDRGQLGQNFDPNTLPNGGGNLPNGNFQGGNFDPNALPQGTRSFNGNTGLARVGILLTGVLHWTFIVLGALAIVGLWFKKRWGAVLAILLAVTAFGFSVPTLFRGFFNAFAIAQTAAVLLLAIGVTILSVLTFRAPKTEAAV